MHENGELDGALGLLTAPARNRYFYGKLLDVRHFLMEQRYFNRKRWMMNRLAVGAGVLCGLDVSVSEDGKKLWIEPGVALDGLGREIVVPARVCLDNPRQPTDEMGRPAGDPVREGEITIVLCYHECPTDPVPVLVRDCDSEDDCAPSTMLERFRVLVRAGAPDRRPGLVAPEQCAAIFPAEPDEGFDHRRAACDTLAPPCDPPDDSCVVLATATVPADLDAPLIVDPCTYRSEVYSNAMLLDLILCLAERVDECCRTHGAPTLLPPVVTAVWPPNGARWLGADPATRPLLVDWIERPRIEVTFDRKMDDNTLSDTRKWIGLWRFLPEHGRLRVRPFLLEYTGPIDPSTAGVPGFTAEFRLREIPGEPEGITGLREGKFLLQIFAHDDNVLDLSTPPLMLDPDFAGTGIQREEVLAEIRKIRKDQLLRQAITTEVAQGLVATQALQRSGDQVPGGLLHTMFETAPD